MNIFIKKISLFIAILILLLVGLSIPKIPEDFVCYKFQKTQYNKISWFLKMASEGKFKERKYNSVFLGSSQCYYAINDSILGSGYLNLGMNTPSRDLDLYLKEKFIFSGGNSESYIVILGNGKVVSFGLHPLIPYLVNPTWLLSKGQSIFSVHFWKYIIKRVQVLFEYLSWCLTVNGQNDTLHSRDYGVGYLDRTTAKKQMVNIKDFDSDNESYMNVNAVSLFDELRHNTRSQWNFIHYSEKLIKNKYLIVPGFQSSNSFSLMTQELMRLNLDKTFIHFKNDKIESILNDPIYWADQGHLNRKGSLFYTKLIAESL